MDSLKKHNEFARNSPKNGRARRHNYRRKHDKENTRVNDINGPLSEKGELALEDKCSKVIDNKPEKSSTNPTDIEFWSKREFSKFIKAFKESEEKTLTFPATLSPFQRSMIHDICTVFGMNHNSSGPKSCRILTISKSAEATCRTIDGGQGYHGAQVFPSLISVTNATDFTELHKELDRLHEGMVKNIKSACRKKETNNRRFFIRTDSSTCRFPPRMHNSEFLRLQKLRESLPAFREGGRVISALRTNDVVVVSGDTGCGKTTQIPQLIYQSGIIDQHKTIICTQPRRISAISVAERVAEEMGENCGSTCGYVIRFENKTCQATKIIYMTTGILLRRLQVDPNLTSVGCVIVDEVHERDLDTDFSLVLLRDLLLAQRSSNVKLKVVVMSATIQIEKIVKYFNFGRPPPTITISGSLFPVKEYFLEDALRATGESVDLSVFTAKEDVRAAPDDREAYAQLYSRFFTKSVEEICLFNTIVKLIIYCHLSGGSNNGSILVFLPGWAQIAKVNSLLKATELSRELWIVFLHSSLTSKEQQRVFQPAPKRYRKVVLSTNIAETSVTISDVIWVIDSCISKGTDYDPTGDFSSLKAVPISKADGAQRRGRAGRCQRGICYHLLPKVVYEKLPDFSLPQILRSSLEEVCLQIKAIKPTEKCMDILRRALDAPPPESVSNSVKFLSSIGAFRNGDEGLTPLGAALAQLPIHPLLGKMLFAATCFGVLESVAYIAASLSVKSPFIVPLPSERQKVNRALRLLDEGMLSDHFCVLRLLENWIQSGRDPVYAHENYADPRTLMLLEKTKNQLVNLVIHSPLRGDMKESFVSMASRYNSNLALVRLVVLWSVYPRIATVEFRVKRANLPHILCWDDSPAQVSSSSVLCSRRRKDFDQKTFLFYFDRLFVESNLTLSEGTAVSPLEVSLCLGKLTVLPLEEVPDELLLDPSSKFLPAYPFAFPHQETVGSNFSLPKKKNLSALFFDGGKKMYVTTDDTAALIQRVRECFDYYLIQSILKLRADLFPDTLVRIISRLLGVTCGPLQDYSNNDRLGIRLQEDSSHTVGLKEFEVKRADNSFLPSGEFSGEEAGNEEGNDEIIEYDDEFIVVNEDEEDEETVQEELGVFAGKVTGSPSPFSDDERAAARSIYGDLTVLQKDEAQQVIREAAALAQKRSEAAKAAIEEDIEADIVA